MHHEGYDAVGAPDGEAALALFDATPGAFKVVITDFGMPGIGGLALATALRAKDTALTVIFCSGLDLGDCRAELASLGARHVLRKPVNPAEIARVLKEAMAG